MKRTALAVAVLLAVFVLAAPAGAARRDDFRVIQNAVRHSPAAAKGHEPRWLKVVVQDRHAGRAGLKITLPVALVEVVLGSADSRRFKVDEDRCEIDLQAVWRALKKAGPLALVEIRDDDGALFKIWLE